MKAQVQIIAENSSDLCFDATNMDKFCEPTLTSLCFEFQLKDEEESDE